MGLEYNWTDAKPDEHDNSLPYEDWEIIEPAIETLETKTGVFIDPYSDTRLSDDHAVLLYELIIQNVANPSARILELCNVLQESKKSGRWLFFIGG